MSDADNDDQEMSDEERRQLEAMEAAQSDAGEDAGNPREDAQRAEFGELTGAERDEGSGDGNLEMILDLQVSLAMEVGRTKISIRNLLQLSQGSVVELDRFAGEPLDVLVNGTLVAHGEVVVVNEKFGIRLTDVISPSERVKKLR
mgnify:CR=1 FL=1